jgi:hypothetical protein
VNYATAEVKVYCDRQIPLRDRHMANSWQLALTTVRSDSLLTVSDTPRPPSDLPATSNEVSEENLLYRFPCHDALMLKARNDQRTTERTTNPQAANLLDPTAAARLGRRGRRELVAPRTFRSCLTLLAVSL